MGKDYHKKKKKAGSIKERKWKRKARDQPKKDKKKRAKSSGSHSSSSSESSESSSTPTINASRMRRLARRQVEQALDTIGFSKKNKAKDEEKKNRSRMMSRALAVGSLNGALPANHQISSPAHGNGNLTSHPGGLAMVVTLVVEPVKVVAMVVAMVVEPVMVVAMVVMMLVGMSMMQGNISSILNTRKSHGRKATRIPGMKIIILRHKKTRGAMLLKMSLKVGCHRGQRGSSQINSKQHGKMHAHQSLHLHQKQMPHLALKQCPKVLGGDPLQVLFQDLINFHQFPHPWNHHQDWCLLYQRQLI